MKNTYRNGLLALALAIGLSSCDSNLSFKALRGDNTKIPQIAVNVAQSESGISIRIPNLDSLPEEIKNATDIEVVYDNSETSLPVTKNSDGSLSFVVGSTVKINSAGDFNVLFVVNNQKSYMATIKTGPILKLQNQGILVEPDIGSIIKGEKIKLTANTIEEKDKQNFIFNWYYGGSPTGQFAQISGTSSSVEWTPPATGSFYIRLQMTDKKTRVSSLYTTPVALIYVTDADNIIGVSPSTGTLLRGSEVTLTSNVPNIIPEDFDYTWSYSASPVGPFYSISGNSQTVKWNPTSSGSFYIKLETVNKKTNKVSTYTSTEPLVMITENENIIKTEPSLGNIVRGGTVQLDANVPVTGDNLEYSWAYTTAPTSGVWQPIPGSGKTLNWSPSVSGSFYVKVDVADKASQNLLTFVSPKAIVFVSEPKNIFETVPTTAYVKLGQLVTVKANIPNTQNESFQFNWSYSASSVGPFSPMSNVKNNSRSIEWRPASGGSFYVKVDAINISTQSVMSFTSSNPIVFVNDNQSLFITDPELARITTESNVDIKLNLDLSDIKNGTVAWSYGPSTAGPWVAIGATTSTKITWDKKPKTKGTYYVKVDITDPSDKTITTFVSKNPIIFVDEDTTSAANSSTFGKSGL